MDQKKETYLQKLMRSSKDLRYILENYLLPEGSFSLLGLTRDHALSIEFDALLTNLKHLQKQAFVYAKIKLLKEYGLVDIVFIAHKELITEMTQDVSLRNKAARKMSFNNTLLVQRVKDIDNSNKNIMFQYLKEQSVELLELTTLPLDKLTPFISNRPFSQEFGNFDKITEIAAALKCEYNKEYFTRLLNRKKVELRHHQKTTRLKEVVFGFFDTEGFTRLGDAIKGIQAIDKNINDLEIKNILSLSKSDFIIAAVQEYHDTEAEYKGFKAMSSKGTIEFQLSGSPILVKRMLKEDEILNILLKKLLFSSIKTTYKFDLIDLKKELINNIYIIQKKNAAGIIYDLLESGVNVKNSSAFLKLKILSQIIEEHRKPFYQRLMEGGTIGTENEKTNLGFKSFEELSSVSKRLLNLILLSEDMRVKNEKLRLWNDVFAESFISNLFSVIFPNKSYKILKDEINDASTKINDYKRALMGKMGVKSMPANQRIVNMILDSIAKAGLNPLQVSSIKNRMEAEPSILLQHVQGKTATLLKDLIKRNKVKEITDTLYQKMGSAK